MICRALTWNNLTLIALVAAVLVAVALILFHRLWRQIEKSGAERQRAEDEVERKNQFLTIVSHELRAPLAAMRIWNGTLRTTLDEATRLRAVDVLFQLFLCWPVLACFQWSQLNLQPCF